MIAFSDRGVKVESAFLISPIYFEVYSDETTLLSKSGLEANYCREKKQIQTSVHMKNFRLLP